MVPNWLHELSIAALLMGAACAATILVDVIRHPQRMAIMNVVWPITALFGTLITVWGYFTYGRLSAREAPDAETPFPVMVAKGASHCGSGCTLGDMVAEWLVFFVPTVATWLGWHSLFEERIFAIWIADYVFAFAIGMAFQYFTIKPMRNLSVGQGLLQALKADVLSLTAWQVGMYGFMGMASLWLFRRIIGRELETDAVEFWFMMQIAMICGFVTSYPVNWWLIRRGIKEAM